MNNSKWLAVIFFCFMTLNNALAANGTNAKTGFYLGAALGDNHLTPPLGSSLNTELDSSNFGIGDFSFMPIIGYRFNDYFALEAAYNDISNDNNIPGENESATNFEGVAKGPDHYRLWSTSLAAKFIHPWSSGWSVYGKAGAAVTHQDDYNLIDAVDTKPAIDSTTTHVQPLAGGGVTYNFTQDTAVDFGYTRQFQEGVTPQISVLSVGLDYTF